MTEQELKEQAFQQKLKDLEVELEANNLVVITKEEYDALIDESEILTELYNNGVDSWEGYGVAMEKIWDREDENEC